MKLVKTVALAGVVLATLATAAVAASDQDICQKESGDVAIAACNRARDSARAP